MVEAIVDLCSIRELNVSELAALLNRKEETIRDTYLKVMCEAGILMRKYPNILTHPNQKYSAKK